MILLAYLLLGAVAGVLAGLFGIGGGLILVPVLVHAFRLQGFSPEVLTHLAVGTSLATIVVTAISSTRAHHEKGGVRWPLFAWLAPAMALGVYLGALTARAVDGDKLQLLLGAYAWFTALHLWRGGARDTQGAHERAVPGSPSLSLAGLAIGWASALFGIGGGSLTVPYLAWRGEQMRKAVGTAAACGLPIAVFGAASNMLLGRDTPGLPEWSTGFVYWPAWFGIVVTSALCARYGARLAHSLSERRLKRSFAVFLFLVGADFFGRAALVSFVGAGL